MTQRLSAAISSQLSSLQSTSSPEKWASGPGCGPLEGVGLFPSRSPGSAVARDPIPRQRAEAARPRPSASSRQGAATLPLSHLQSPVLSVTLRGGKRDQACDGPVNSTGKRKGSTLRRSPTTLTNSGLEGRGSCGSTEGLL